MNQLTKCLLIMCYLLMVLCSSISFAAARYQSKSETVLDIVTKLIWQEEAPNQTYTWSEAEAYCQQQNAEKLGGYSAGWRLPNISELLTIVDHRTTRPVVDQDAFFGPIDLYWTSTPKYGVPSSVWVVTLGDKSSYGSNYWYDKTDNYYVRCVREAG